jgi:hypothetical protein
MTTLKTRICVKKLGGVVLAPGDADNPQLAATLAASMMSLGFLPSRELQAALASSSAETLATFEAEVLAVLRELKGAHVEHTPLYPNFPTQVMEASAVELFLVAIAHYWSGGTWKPDYEKLPRELRFEETKFREVGLVSEADYLAVFPRLLSSNDSLSEEDKGYIEHFMVEEPEISFPETIPFKETMCVVAGMFLRAGKDISQLVKTATDVLRVVTYLNGGDVSLAENTRFKSMPRAQRRQIVALLDAVANEEDIDRHRGKWVRLFHSLHVGEYAGERLAGIAHKIRNNEKIETFNGRVEQALQARDLRPLLTILRQRPGVFARRLDELLRVFEADDDRRAVVAEFADLADSIPTRILVQLLGHFQSRRARRSSRVVFPKGAAQKARIIPAAAPLDADLVALLVEGLETTLRTRFATQGALGKVWVDLELAFCPVPSQQRSASEGGFNVARGTHLALGDPSKSTLRLFVYWVGRDIDLSATLHDADFKLIEPIAYTNLRSEKYEACHSGDITNAPEGASEFIDITIESAAKHGIRYVVMNVLVFSGPSFGRHETCFAGWMTREHPNSNEVFDAKTVEHKVDLTSSARNAVPVVFDLVERKAIWCDLTTGRDPVWGIPNNVETNQASIEAVLEAIVTSASKLSLYDLFRLHGEARGELVATKDEAEQVFSLSEGVTPFDQNVIASEYLA